jgi:hypothetical protein
MQKSKQKRTKWTYWTHWTMRLYNHTVEVGGSSPSAPTQCVGKIACKKQTTPLFGGCVFHKGAGAAKSVAKVTQLFHIRDWGFERCAIYTHLTSSLVYEIQGVSYS